MFTKTTRGRHGAPRQRRGWLTRTRPACGPIPVLGEPDAVPSMELPDGHMAQRPSPVYVGTLLPKASRYRKDDVVVVTGGVHSGRRGIVAASYGAGRPLTVDVEGGIVFLAEDDVQLVRRPSDADTEQFATVHVQVPVTVIDVEHADGTPVGYWMPSEDAPTLTMAAIDEDDMVLIGGASR